MMFKKVGRLVQEKVSAREENAGVTTIDDLEKLWGPFETAYRDIQRLVAASRMVPGSVPGGENVCTNLQP